MNTKSDKFYEMTSALDDVIYDIENRANWDFDNDDNWDNLITSVKCALNYLNQNDQLLIDKGTKPRSPYA